ncbi:unnamed protein product [Echinostoma caproni]|uniref:Uncharacterized protein n=1 Tax=Echinostoma caproni TaxID=27848 RepID=A0A3P8KGW6_9TREM|nr:unnamed protein product [Echinostoma caproni]
MDSVYNEHLLTIGQLQDEVKALKRQLAQKDAEMLAKDRTIAELRSELIDTKEFHESRLLKARAAAQLEQDRLTVKYWRTHLVVSKMLKLGIGGQKTFIDLRFPTIEPNAVWLGGMEGTV